MRWMGRAALCLCALFGLGLGSAFAQPAPVNPRDLPIHAYANIFDPKSAPAHSINEAAWFVLWICAGIFLVVSVLITYAVIKFRHKSGDDRSEPPQVYGSTQIELAWTVLPILITVVLILVTARTIGEIQNAKLSDDRLRVRVVGHQWWWEIHYPEYGIVTANEVHVPVSREGAKRPTELLLQSADVIHSFWAPQLAGKVDLVPNRDNNLWIEPEITGIFLGNCAEYCGTQHANMKIRVVVQEPADFELWVKNQQKPPVDNPQVAKGKALFNSVSCVNCHTIGQSPINAVFGPNLTHLMSRQTLGAGVAPLTPEKLREWVKDPQPMKVGCLMPNMQLSQPEVDEIVAYLLTLE